MIALHRPSRRLRAAVIGVAMLLTAVVGPLAAIDTAVASGASAPAVSPDAPTFTQPTTVPQFVWRMDTRSPDEITAAGGFAARGKNTNLADHVIFGRGTASDSVFVSATSDEELAKNWILKFRTNEAWVYKIETDFTSYSVPASLNAAIEAHPDWLTQWQRKSRYWFKRNVETQQEWANAGGVELERVQSAEHWVDVFDRTNNTHELKEVVKDKWTNEGFTPRPPGSEAELEPFPVEEVTLCKSRTTCELERPTGDELEQEHAERFDGTTEDTDLTLRPEDLLEDEELMVAPLPDTIAVADEYAEHSFTSSSLAEYGEDLADAFRADHAALETLSASEEVLGPVARVGERAIDIGSELVPYLGIAATGYALTEDVEAGRWGDAAADAIIEALQVAVLAQGELAPLLEPAIIVVAVIQLIADNLWGWTHPQPAVSPEQEGHISRANDAADEVIGKSLASWDRERAALAQQFIAEHADEGLATSLARKARTDIDVIAASSRAVQLELESARLSALHRHPGDPAVQRSFDEAMARLHAVTYERQEHRLDQYRERMPDLIEAVGDEFWEHSGLDDVRQRFVAEQMKPYVTKVTRNIWEAVTGVEERDWFDEFGGAWVHGVNLDRVAWGDNVLWMFQEMDAVRPAPAGGFLPDTAALSARLESSFFDAVGPARLLPPPGLVHISSATWSADGIRLRGEAEPGKEIKSTNDPTGGWHSLEGGVTLADANGSFSAHTRRSIEERAVVRSDGEQWSVSVPVVPRPTITRSERDADGVLLIEGHAAPGSEIKTTNDPSAGWYSIEGGVVRADQTGHFVVHTRRSVDGQAVIRAFGKDSPVSNSRRF